MRLALLSVLLVACAYEDSLPVASPDSITTAVSYTIHGDANFTPAERSTIEWAAGEWGRFTDGRARIRMVWDYTDVTYMAFQSVPHLRRLRPEDVPSPTVAGWEYDHVNIALMPDLCPVFVGCALHELGHLVGLGHVMQSGCVMSAWNPASTFQPPDLTECQRVGLCGKPRPKDVTTVTVTVDPSIPNVTPEYPR